MIPFQNEGISFGGKGRKALRACLFGTKKERNLLKPAQKIFSEFFLAKRPLLFKAVDKFVYQTKAILDGALEHFLRAVRHDLGHIVGIAPFFMFGVEQALVFFGEHTRGKTGIRPIVADTLDERRLDQGISVRARRREGIQGIEGGNFFFGNGAVEIFSETL